MRLFCALPVFVAARWPDLNAAGFRSPHCRLARANAGSKHEERELLLALPAMPPAARIVWERRDKADASPSLHAVRERGLIRITRRAASHATLHDGGENNAPSSHSGIDRGLQKLMLIMAWKAEVESIEPGNREAERSHAQRKPGRRSGRSTATLASPDVCPPGAQAEEDQASCNRCDSVRSSEHFAPATM